MVRVVKRTQEDMRKFIINSSHINSNGCWIWDRVKIKDGYGRLKHQYKSLLAHRVSFTVFNGEIPTGKLVCHHCDTPSCVNPMHLFLGDNKINSDDKIKKHRECRSFSVKNRQATHCINGHKFTQNNMYKRSRPGGGRICKTCTYIRKGVAYAPTVETSRNSNS